MLLLYIRVYCDFYSPAPRAAHHHHFPGRVPSKRVVSSHWPRASALPGWGWEAPSNQVQTSVPKREASGGRVPALLLPAAASLSDGAEPRRTPPLTRRSPAAHTPQRLASCLYLRSVARWVSTGCQLVSMTALSVLLLLLAVSAASVLAESSVHLREQFEDGGEIFDPEEHFGSFSCALF